MQQSERLTHRARRVSVIAIVLLFLAGAGLIGVRDLRREWRTCVMLCHEVERSAAPEERVVVDDRALEWCMRHAGSMELRRKIVFVGWRSEEISLPPGGQEAGSEFVVVTTADDPLLARIRARGWMVREATDDRPRFAVGRGAVEIFFVAGQ